MQEQDWIERAGDLFEAAMFGGDASALDRSDDVLDAVEPPLSMARDKVLHVRFLNDREENGQELVLFERAAELYERLGTRRVRRTRCSGSAAGTRWSRVTTPPAGHTSSGRTRWPNPSTTE
ncbi:hypothetical protein [Streptomyces gibsoniae]|uniref:Uncharacterized protein n=1 Tax=Streptomyces gibsoniae TaxID=3075529 RepID=A0ABU2TZM9_9ACTN|nr:hypothetical protein [Streptomyces sp. DSM 41699]MDT0466429.1 hypothetical protein [Streptomyces sp. DSM 41699]